MTNEKHCPYCGESGHDWCDAGASGARSFPPMPDHFIERLPVTDSPWAAAVAAVAHDVGCGTAYAATHSWGGAAIGYRCDCDRDARIAKGIEAILTHLFGAERGSDAAALLAFAEASDA